MKQRLLKYFFLSWLCCIFFSDSFSQNSVLVNVGSRDCATPEAPILSLIKNPFSVTPDASTVCDLSAQLQDYFFVFVAYNPSDNKIYVNEVRNFINSKIWKLDIGLPGDIACPASIPIEPTYIVNYTINNFEFDNSGNLWAIRNYDPATGQCIIENTELANGSVISGKILQFPEGHFPTDIGSGDLAILPNGRFFATLGRDPSQLYEIKNYNGGTGNATADFLQAMPSNTFGLAYLNGELEITGTNSLDSCYYFDYDISSNTLVEKKLFQNGQSAIDNTSISPVVGITKELTNVTKVNDNTADIVYEMYVQNMGNAILQNINIADNLENAFGAGNVSNVSTNFVPGYNVPGLILNSDYNGITDTDLLGPGQTLTNETSATANYFFKIDIHCRVTNLRIDTIYYNSAIASCIIGSSLSQTLINVTDSSNNGPASVIDPNMNGRPNEPGENIPTPLDWKKIILPVSFINVHATVQNTNAIIQWQIAAPAIDANKFEVQYSVDGINWETVNQIKITDRNQTIYQVEQTNIPSGNVYYRIKQIDNNGFYIFSKIVMLNNKTKNSFTIYPNPANNFISIDKGYSENKNVTIELFNAVGQKLFDKRILTSSEKIQTAGFPNGTYLLKLIDNDEVKTYKIIIKH